MVAPLSFLFAAAEAFFPALLYLLSTLAAGLLAAAFYRLLVAIGTGVPLPAFFTVSFSHNQKVLEQHCRKYDAI